MLARNFTPFAAMGFAQLHRDGPMMACITVRATFEIRANGKLSVAERQELVLADQYAGDPLRTSMVKSSDLAPFKPATDVTLVGNAYAPNGRASPGWLVSLAVGDQVLKLRVSGPRQWLPGLKGLKPSWKLGPSEAVDCVPLDYCHASGGRFIGDPDGDAERRNPIGSGMLHGDFTRYAKAFPAPQLDSEDAPVAGPYDAPEPQGFGPISPWWIQRQRFAGTYDDDWKANRHPRLPAAFDYRFYQSAHPRLIMPGYLRGDERITANGCHRSQQSLSFRLPGIAIVADHSWDDGREARTRLRLDGVHLDLRDQVPRVDLTWRGWITRCPAYLSADIDAVSLFEAEALPGSDETGLVEANPASEGAAS
ncbi:Hypothetical protein NGAL_HAMBI1145_24410 [Neorhizobium galegae bv. officinalis]|uniref:DUF2169 domain-containing protein n=1 Tax=Neorhizobium galegae bv. officinalis TaxID=323656 RepID=A0A0T7FI09_NEOGA|nr:DUF2169 domain-containing protein [Neorhizobium galegae]CDZ34651.1 Hypothetical protein NGAL_HAMBI1145_24410 [Neorhizobium galegae bv. officinalis]